jgi:OOP family OmpA-OmpF porin
MEHFRKRLILLAVASASAAGIAYAEEEFDNRFYVAPMGSYVLADDSRTTDDGYGGVLAIGKPLFSKHLELEARGSFLKYDPGEAPPGGLLCDLLGLGCPAQPDGAEITAGGVGANVFLSSAGKGVYVHLDAMFGDSNLYNAGLGFDLPFSSIGLRFEALYHIDDAGDFDYEETQFNLGLRIPIGARPAPVPETVEPVQVVPPVEPPPPPPPPPAPCLPPAPGQTVNLEGCAVGDVIVLRGVNFEFDKSTLEVNARTLLDQVADALLSRPGIKFEIGGHTDGKGSDQYNQDLSERRALSVQDYLASRGVDASRMSTRGYGESAPVADNDTDEGRELNRRVELKVTQTTPP